MPQPLLELQNITYSYEGHPNALQDISLTFHKGEKIALLGSNGAGKSTLFLTCNGVLPPEKGQVIFKGKPVTSKKSDLILLRAHIGIVFQEPDRQLIAPTVETEISFGPMNLLLGEEEVERRVDKALAALHLEEFRSRPPHYLSGGEKKLVSIADVLAMEPDMILMDEPAAALDPQNTQLFENILQELHTQNIAIVVSTHDVDFAWRWADRCIVLHQGQVLNDASPESIFADTALLKTASLKQPCLFELAAAFSGSAPANYAHFPKTSDAFIQFIKHNQ